MYFGGLRNMGQWIGSKTLGRYSGSSRGEKRKALKNHFVLGAPLLYVLEDILNKEDIKL